MVEPIVQNAANPTTEPVKEEKKKGFGAKFVNFLMMGGFLVILIVGVAIAIGISMLFK
jgi:hypothetical protein